MPAAGLPVPGPDADRDLPLDAHLHTDLSPDSDVPIDAYCAAAVERGVAELAITDHLDFNRQAPAYGFADFDRRERMVRGAAERWAGHGLAVRFGVEISYESALEAEIRRYLAAHPYDFVIGSVHVMQYSPLTGGRVAAWVAGKSFDEIVAPYFEEVLGAIRSGLFDTLGHLDYVKKYLVGLVPPATFAGHPDAYEPLLRALVDTGTALEVNSSGLRHAPGETYPAAWAVARFRELGGSRVTAGSDAHHIRQFAYGLAHAYAAAAAAGIVELTFRRGAGLARGSAAVAIPDRLVGAAAAGGATAAAGGATAGAGGPASRPVRG